MEEDKRGCCLEGGKGICVIILLVIPFPQPPDWFPRRAGWPAHPAPPSAPGSPGPAVLPGLGFPFAPITPKPLSSKWLHTHTQNSKMRAGGTVAILARTLFKEVIFEQSLEECETIPV